MNVATNDVKVADEVWIATALLHREHPLSEDFSVPEVKERARQENIAGRLRSGVYVHANTHCVANQPPSPATLRMLYETRRGRRRLFRDTDDSHPDRHGRILPKREEIPEQYRYLLDWYETEYGRHGEERWLSGIFDMIGTGKEMFARESPDEYIRRLREGWEYAETSEGSHTLVHPQRRTAYLDVDSWGGDGEAVGTRPKRSGLPV